MKQLWNWAWAWAETIEIRLRKPKLYALLRDDSFDWDEEENE